MLEAMANTGAAQRRRILIVEDEVLIAMVLEDILDMIGHDVVGTAVSYADAEVAIAAGGFDLAVLDVNLGAEPVYPLADRIAALGTDIIFATGSHPDSLPQRFRGSAVLEKPYAFQAVEAALGKLS
ncbi:MAG: response regulator [Janthinobacterium lividum]